MELDDGSFSKGITIKDHEGTEQLAPLQWAAEIHQLVRFTMTVSFMMLIEVFHLGFNVMLPLQ
jgi:hypothetical protein